MKTDIISILIKKLLTKQLILTSRNVVRFSSKPAEQLNSDEIKSVAIHFHIFYLELLPEILSYLKNITAHYDLFISTSSEEKVSKIKQFFENNKISAKNIFVQSIENRGRDIYPFIEQLKPVINNYEIVAHFHSKKTVEIPALGDGWRKYLFDNLIGNGSYCDNLLSYMTANKDVGFVAPPPYFHNIKPYILSMKDKEYLDKIEKVLEKANVYIEDFYTVAKDMNFPAGNMFFARTSAIHQVFESFSAEDFPEETGQIENTLQHTIERIWNFLVFYNGYKYIQCLKN